MAQSMTKSRSLRRTLLCGTYLSFVAVAALVGCGGTDETVLHKTYLFNLEGSLSAQNTLKELITEFNSEAGSNYLQVAEGGILGNSTITLISDLEMREGKLGYGSWIIDEQQSSSTSSLLTIDNTTELHYSMKLELDEAFFEERQDLPKTDLERQRLKILVYHEIGHGLLMNHDAENDTSVMFPTIKADPNVDLSAYFERVRAFFRDN